MGSYYPDEIRAQARALLLQGYTCNATADRIGVAQATVSRWRDEFTSLSDEQSALLADNERRIALRADKLLEAKLDYLEEKDRTSEIPIRDLTILTGVMRDKQIRRSGIGDAKQTNVLILINQREAELLKQGVVVEGQIVSESALLTAPSAPQTQDGSQTQEAGASEMGDTGP